MAQDKKIKIVIEAVDKATDTLSKIGGNIRNVALGSVAGLAGGMAAAGLAIGKLAADAEPLVGVQNAFNALTGEVRGGSQEMLRALQDASFGLISNADLMTSYNKAAQLVGQDFATQLPGALESVGKVAAATGQDMGFLMDSLVTGIGRLSPMILDNLGIQVSLTEANQAYADSLGIEVEEMTKAQQQAALMDQVMGKLQENTASMAAPSGGFASLGIIFTNLKDTIGMELVPVVAPLLEQFAGLAKEVLPELLYRFKYDLLPALQEGIGVIMGYIQRLPEFAAKFREIKDKVLEFVAPVTTWIAEFTTWKDVLIALGIVLGGIILSALVSLIITIGPVILAIAAIIAVVTLLRTHWTEIMAKLEETIEQWSFIVETAVALVKLAWEQFLVRFDMIKFSVQTGLDILARGWESFKVKIQTVVATIVSTIESISDAVAGVIGWIQGLIDKLSSIQLPDFLTRHSPSPFEQTLWGVAEAMESVTNASGMMGAGLRFGTGGPGDGVTYNYTLNQNIAGDAGNAAESFALMQAIAGVP